jgi:hypothetical protein
MSSIINVGDVVASNNYFTKSSVAWGAIISGAVAAVAVSLILLILGSALGLSSISPWSYGQTVAAFTVKAAIWLIVMQWVASGLGGYIAGRLRNKWINTDSEEVLFRDTAHGFLTWAVATLLAVTLFTSTAASIVSGGVKAVSTVASGVAANSDKEEVFDNFGANNAYYIDTLFRSATPNTNISTKEVTVEATRILANGIKNGNVSDADKAYLAQLVSARTGISTEEASRRVDDVISQLNSATAKAKEDAEKARKTAMQVSIYIFLSLLIGAFIASCSAALGGRHRDQYQLYENQLK